MLVQANSEGYGDKGFTASFEVLENSTITLYYIIAIAIAVLIFALTVIIVIIFAIYCRYIYSYVRIVSYASQ